MICFLISNKILFFIINTQLQKNFLVYFWKRSVVLIEIFILA